MRKVLVSVLAVSIAVVAVGCGSSSEGADGTTTTAAPTTTAGVSVDDATAEDYTAAFVSNLSTGSLAESQLVIPEAGATCVAPRWVEAIGLDTLKAADVDPAQVADPSFNGSLLDIDQSQSTQMVEAFAACDVDVFALFAEMLTAGLTPEQQACAVESIDRDHATEILVKTFANDITADEFQVLVDELGTACDLPSGG